MLQNKLWKKREDTFTVTSQPLNTETAEWLQDDSNLSDEDKEKLQKIREVLDMEIRPYLQGDGGDLHIVGLEQNYLQVHYQGACGSCPSSLTGTLSGIQYLVQRIDPNLEVVAV